MLRMNENTKVTKAIAHTQTKRKQQGIQTLPKPWFIGIPIACCIYQVVEYLDISEVAKSIILIIVGLSCLASSGYMNSKYRKGNSNVC